MRNLVIEVKDLYKYYGSYSAVKGVSFSVHPGEVFGLLGPNGAGKTTTIECLEGLKKADSGSINILGLNPAKDSSKLIKKIGIQLQSQSLPQYMKVKEVFDLFCSYRGVKPDYGILERLGLTQKLQNLGYSLSVGEKRRLTLALAVCQQPEVLFLDEPTAGLDVSSRHELHAMIKQMQSSGCTVLLSTHDMAEAESLTDRVAILLQGKIAAIGTPRELTSTKDSLTKVTVKTASGSLNRPDIPYLKRLVDKEDCLLLFTDSPGNLVLFLLAEIEKSGDQLIDLRVERPSLEERFIELVGLKNDDK
jgi:ABC-2 type transport system ATP-binding protein